MAADLAYFPVRGRCDARFEGVKTAFENNFQQGFDVGASVAITIDGECVVDLWGGAGGSLIVVDFERRMTFAYAMNQLEASPFGDRRGQGLVAATYQALKN
jgi:hypothetical protein